MRFVPQTEAEDIEASRCVDIGLFGGPANADVTLSLGMLVCRVRFFDPNLVVPLATRNPQPCAGRSVATANRHTHRHTYRHTQSKESEG